MSLPSPPFDPQTRESGRAVPVPRLLHQRHARVPAPHVLIGPEPPAGGLVISFQPSITSTHLHDVDRQRAAADRHLAVWAAAAPASRAGCRTSASGPTSCCPTSALDRRARGRALHPDLCRVLPADPVLELGRPGANRRARGVPARADQRRQRHARPGPGQLLHLRGRGLPPAGRRAATCRSSFLSTSSRTASAPA